MTGRLTQTLVDLHPAGFDAVRRSQRAADVVRPYVGGEAVVGGVGHADSVGLIGPADSNQDRTEDLLACQAPIVGSVSEHRWKRKVSLSYRRTAACPPAASCPRRGSHTPSFA